MTSKLQITVPKAVAEAHGLKPGAQVEFESAGETIRMRVRTGKRLERRDPEQRLRSFDRASERQDARNERFQADHPEFVEPGERGWRREELYGRGLAR